MSVVADRREDCNPNPQARQACRDVAGEAANDALEDPDLLEGRLKLEWVEVRTDSAQDKRLDAVRHPAIHNDIAFDAHSHA